MGVNNPYFPSNVLNTEEALQYLGALSKATRTQRYAAKTGSPTLTGAEMADAVVEISGGSTATIPRPPARRLSLRCRHWMRMRTLARSPRSRS